MKRIFTIIKENDFMIAIIVITALFSTGIIIMNSNQESPQPEEIVEIPQQQEVKGSQDNSQEYQEIAPLDQQEDTSTETSQIGSGDATYNTPTQAPPSTQQTTTPQPPVATCNESLASSFRAIYDSSVISEDVRYRDEVRSIKEYYNSRGILDSGMCYEALAQAESQHNINLNNLYVQYLNKLTQINCTP